MINATIKMGKQVPKTIFSCIVAAIAFILVAFIKMSVLLVIVLSGIIGILFTLVRKEKKQ